MSNIKFQYIQPEAPALRPEAIRYIRYFRSCRYVRYVPPPPPMWCVKVLGVWYEEFSLSAVDTVKNEESEEWRISFLSVNVIRVRNLSE